MEIETAQTNLDYTRIVAPTDGIVGERKVRIGQLVSPGTQVISLVENTIWVQANYKETQLTNVAKGDAAEITVDTFPGVVLRGHVEAFASWSGLPRVLLYDNLKSVVLERHGDAIRFHPTLLAFAAHYRFEARPVAIARGNEKGRVERAVRFAREAFFAVTAR